MFKQNLRYRKYIPIPIIMGSILLTTMLVAQKSRVIITGKVFDNQTQKPLLGANVMIDGTLLGCSTDNQGEFFIHNVPPGQYNITATMIGYKKQILKNHSVTDKVTPAIQFNLEPTILQQPTLIVTASKRKQHLQDASTSVDVISKRDIQSRGIRNLDEVLENTPGLIMVDNQINLRGSTGFNMAAGSRVLLMIDGQPMIIGDTGGIGWDAFSIDQIERIEIVKGAGSALYGSNAMAGMVNIITQDPSPIPETRIKLSYGFYDDPAYAEWRWWKESYKPFYLFGLKSLDLQQSRYFQGIDLSHSRQIGKLGFLLNLGRKTSTGYTQNGDESRWNGMGKLKIRFTPQKSLTLIGNWALNDHGHFLQWISQDRPLEVSDEELGNWLRYEKGYLNAKYQHGVNQKLAYELKANVYRCHWENHFHDNLDRATTDRIGGEAQINYIYKRHSITSGTEFIVHVTESMIYGNHTLWDVACYCEDELKISPIWTLNLGTRFDHHHVPDISTDQQISPRAGMVWKPQEGTSIRISAGHGFRAPSIAEVFPDITVSGFHVVPNLNLKRAERAISFELGFSQILTMNTINIETKIGPINWLIQKLNPQLGLDIAFFLSRYSNMIDATFDFDNMEAKFMNLGKARIIGMESRFQSSFFNSHIIASIGYTCLDPINLDTNKMLPYRSKHQIVTSLQFRLWKILLGWDYRYASQIQEIIYILGSGPSEQVPIHVMDTRINFDFNHFQIGLEGKNIRNYHYTLRQKTLEPIRHYILTIRGKF